MKHFLAILFSFFGTFLCAQSYFNNIERQTQGGPDASIMVTDTGYIVLGQSTLDLRQTDIGFFDLKGQLLKAYSYLDTNISDFNNCGKCFQKIGNHFYAAKTNFYSSDSTTVLFWQLNDTLGVVKELTYSEFESFIPNVRSMSFDTDSTFIATGYLYREETSSNRFKYDLWVARFDTAFNVLWERRFEDNFPGLNNGYRGTDLVIDAYGSVLVTGEGRVLDNGSQTFLYYALAARLNRQSGNLHWLKEFRGPEGSYFLHALDEGNGTYRFAETQMLSLFPNTTRADSTQIRFGLLDTAGTIVWDTMTGPKFGIFFIRDLQRTQDGNYYVSGEYNLPWYEGSAGFKISPAGDSLWFRQYYYEDTLDLSHVWNFQPTPDSGFVHVGIYFDKQNPQIGTYNWLLKTDKYGCVVKDCHTISLEEPAALPGIEVYPNPSVGIFYLRYPTQADHKKLTITVYNPLGKKVLEQKGKNRLDLSMQPPGVYLLNVTENHRLMYSQKLVKE